MQKNIKVKSVSIIKEGTNDKTGKDWKLYEVECEGDDDMDKFTTFNGMYENSEGQQFQDNFEYNTQYKKWETISASKAEKNSQHEELLNGLRKIFEKLNEIENKINENCKSNN